MELETKYAHWMELGYMGSVFLWLLNLVRLYSLCKILYPKRRIESYSIRGTIVSPNKILLILGLYWG